MLLIENSHLISLLAAFLFEFLKLSNRVAIQLLDGASLIASYRLLPREVRVVELRRLVVLLCGKVKVVRVLVVTQQGIVLLLTLLLLLRFLFLSEHWVRVTLFTSCCPASSCQELLLCRLLILFWLILFRISIIVVIYRRDRPMLVLIRSGL